MTTPISQPPPSNFVDRVGEKVAENLATAVVCALLIDMTDHVGRATIAAICAGVVPIASGGTIYAAAGVIAASAGMPVVPCLLAGKFLLVYGTLRCIPVELKDPKQTEDYRLLTDLFAEKCGGITENAAQREKVRDALSRARKDKDPLYEKYEERFFQCVHHSRSLPKTESAVKSGTKK